MNIRYALQAIIFIVIIPLIMSACNNSSVGTPEPSEAVTTALPHSMKGYELYSWSSDNQWHFTLITGTNRTKSYEEIVSNENMVTSDGWVKISAQGVDSIQNVIKRLPQHEEVFWADQRWLGQSQGDEIKLPPQEIINAIQKYCKQLELNLHVSDSQ